MLFHMYQVFSSLHGHLQFFVHFFFTFMEHFFIDHPILLLENFVKKFHSCLLLMLQNNLNRYDEMTVFAPLR